MLKTKEIHRQPFDCPVLGGTAIIAFYIETENEQPPIEGNPLITSHQFNCNSVDVCGIRTFDENGDPIATDWMACPAYPKVTTPNSDNLSDHQIE